MIKDIAEDSCHRCEGSGLRFGGKRALHQHPAWLAGVRWAAAEADAQAAWREPVYILDVTDHLRACADQPDRASAIDRAAAPETSSVDRTPEHDWQPCERCGYLTDPPEAMGVQQ
jgi:hypothetical protein